MFLLSSPPGGGKDNHRQLTLEEKDKFICNHCGNTQHNVLEFDWHTKKNQNRQTQQSSKSYNSV